MRTTSHLSLLVVSRMTVGLAVYLVNPVAPLYPTSRCSSVLPGLTSLNLWSCSVKSFVVGRAFLTMQMPTRLANSFSLSPRLLKFGMSSAPRAAGATSTAAHRTARPLNTLFIASTPPQPEKDRVFAPGRVRSGNTLVTGLPYREGKAARSESLYPIHRGAPHSP